MMMMMMMCVCVCRVECLPVEEWEKGIQLYRQRHTGKVLLTNYGDDVCM